MKYQVDKVIQELQDFIHAHRQYIQTLQSYNDTLLNQRLHEESWSVLECVEHINLYADFYLTELKKRIAESKYPFQSTYKSGWLGEYFAQSMKPVAGMKKMKTFKSKNPMHSRVSRTVLQRFLEQQEEWLQILDSAQVVDWTKTKSSITISPLIKLRLGDTIRFCIYHQWRHIVQIQKIIYLFNNHEATA